MTSSDDIAVDGGMRRVLILYEDEQHASSIAADFLKRGMAATICSDADSALVSVYNDPPDLIVVHEEMGPRGGVHLAGILKQDSVYAHLPILMLVLPENLKNLLEEDDYPFDDYVPVSAPKEEIQARASLCLIRANRQLDANPLTRLPGNNSINKELETRIARGEEFATVYCDLDNFKAFNDRYGFARGDQAIKMTARLMVNCAGAVSPKDHYAGHIGGDDFVFMVPGEKAEEACNQFIANFDAIAPSLYDDEDRRQGCIRSKNRKGQFEIFPLMSISLAVSINRNAQFQHPGQISTVAAELKKVLKKRGYSSFKIDQRTYGKTKGEESAADKLMPAAETPAEATEASAELPAEETQVALPEERRKTERRRSDRRLDHRLHNISPEED